MHITSKSFPWIAIAGLVVLAWVIWFLSPTSEWLKSFIKWIKEFGALGWGFLLVMMAGTAGACLAFLVSRYPARRPIEDLIESRPESKAVDKAIQEDGWKVVMLLRLSPVVPFNLPNYIYGLTSVNFRHSIAATQIDIAPGPLIYVYLGAAGKAVLSAEANPALRSNGRRSASASWPR